MGAAEEADYSIKPENATPTIPMSEFPLLLKNYDKCMRLSATQETFC